MTATPVVIAIGVVDARGVAGTSGVCREWADLGVEPPGRGGTFRELFSRPDPTFRRLDRASRTLVLATEAAGLQRVLGLAARDDTALVVETERGSLDTDLRFAASLDDGVVDGPLFAYTLPSTCLGEVALRHGLRGPTLCISTGPGDAGEALREAARLLAVGEPSYALAGSVEALAEPCGDAEPALHAVVVLLAAAVQATEVVAEEVAAWPGDSSDPFAHLAATVARN